MKRIVYTQADGIIAVVHPCISKDDPEGFTEDDALQRALKKDVPEDATDISVVDLERIPADRSFRNAWKIVDKTIEIDMPKAREILRTRFERRGVNEDAAIDAAKTPEELKAIRPQFVRR